MKKFLLSIFTVLCTLLFSIAFFGCAPSALGSSTDSVDNSESVDNSDSESDEEVYKPESLDKAISLGEMDFSAWNGEDADSYDALKAYYETEEGKGALATFDTNYWDVENGYPVWKEKVR